MFFFLITWSKALNKTRPNNHKLICFSSSESRVLCWDRGVLIQVPLLLTLKLMYCIISNKKVQTPAYDVKASVALMAKHTLLALKLAVVSLVQTLVQWVQNLTGLL